MDNNYTGDTTIILAGKTYTVCFTWRALAEFKTKFGNFNFSNILLNLDTEKLAEIVEIGLRHHHKDDKITADFILDLDPAPDLTQVVSAIFAALDKVMPEKKSSEEQEDSNSPPQAANPTATS